MSDYDRAAESILMGNTIIISAEEKAGFCYESFRRTCYRLRDAAAANGIELQKNRVVSCVEMDNGDLHIRYKAKGVSFNFTVMPQAGEQQKNGCE